MLNFPFYDSLVMVLPIFFFLGLVISIAAARSWGLLARHRRQPPETVFHTEPIDDEEYSGFRAVFTTFVGIIFILVGSLGTFFIGRGKYQFRSLPVDKLLAIEIYRAKNEYSVDKAVLLRVENTNGKVSDGLKLLQKCGESFRNHESYRDGYSIHLLFDDQSLSDYWIAVFRKSSSSDTKTIVMPQREPIRNTNLGEYSCPAFNDWVKQNIDPLVGDDILASSRPATSPRTASSNSPYTAPSPHLSP